MTPTLAPTAYDALVFDVGGVIVSHDNAAMYRQIASRCASAPTLPELKSVIRRTKWSLGVEPIANLHVRLRDELGYTGDWPQFQHDWSCHLVVDPSMLAFVARLAATHRVILFSNTNAEHARYTGARMQPLRDVERYLSCDLGLAKPSPEAFLKVAELAGIDPRRSLMIDDVQENVDGARAAGFQALLFEGEAELAAALRRVG